MQLMLSLKLHTLALKDLIFKLMLSKYGSLLSHLSHSFQKISFVYFVDHTPMDTSRIVYSDANN